MNNPKLTLDSFEAHVDCTVCRFNCDFTVTTAGDGLWGCEAGRKVNVSGITVITSAFEGEVSVMVNVSHDSTWDIYTDRAFEAAISAALGFEVGFTEQGMQEDGHASMEAYHG